MFSPVFAQAFVEFNSLLILYFSMRLEAWYDMKEDNYSEERTRLLIVLNYGVKLILDQKKPAAKKQMTSSNPTKKLIIFSSN